MSPPIIVPPTPEQTKDLDKRFGYHPPSDATVVRAHEGIRAELRFTASEILRTTPPGREQALALTKIEEAMFWANAAIARNQPEDPTDV